MGINIRHFSFVRTVGITGGVCSGTSTFAYLFNSHGIPVVDANVITDGLLNRGSVVYREVVAAFGSEILQNNGFIDRPRLYQMISDDPYRRQFFYGLLAPYIRAILSRKIFEFSARGHRLIVIDAPMLFEVQMDRMIDRNVVVWVDPETQVRRLMARDGISWHDAVIRINAQMPLDAKRDLANWTINNTGSRDALNEQFQRVLHDATRPLTWPQLIYACLLALFDLGIFILPAALVVWYLFWD